MNNITGDTKKWTIGNKSSAPQNEEFIPAERKTVDQEKIASIIKRTEQLQIELQEIQRETARKQLSDALTYTSHIIDSLELVTE